MCPVLKSVITRIMESSLLKNKFRGALKGSLLGDCLGAPYEGDEISSGDKIIIQRYFDTLEDPNFTGPYRKYTDDTAMMKSVAMFLIDKPEPDFKYLAGLFVREFFSEPNRGYGANIVDVFEKLKKTKLDNIYKPATEQFGGSGSYGNGGAMRIAPVALYFHDNYNTMLEVARNVTRITHTNILGVNGALLQCIAVHQALMTNPADKIKPKAFCQELYEKMRKIEGSERSDKLAMAYQDKLKIVEVLLERKYTEELDEEVVAILGNGIRAYESVPTAIYCFLRAQNEIPEVQTDNIFRRTIQYAITLGGDTDTIACMAGAIAGAYLGDDSINKHLVKHCEFYEEISEMADNLFAAKENAS